MLNWLTNWGRKPAVDPLEEKLKSLEAELRDRLQESLNYYGLPGVPYPGSLDFLRPGMSDDWGFGYRNRNRRGDNPQVYLHDEQLKQVRERSRDLAARNEYARNALRVRQTYIVGTGLRTTAMPRKNLEDDARAVAAADEVQSFLEVWAAYTKLYPKQKEFQLRKDRDGEAFIRLFRGKRFLEYNFIEPEHVVDYTGQYTFGIETDPDDITKIIAYYVRPDEQGQPEKVDAEKVIHIKANVDSGIKRGLPFLYPIFNVLEKIESADENMAAIMKIQGSIAMIRRHQVARSSAVSSGVSSRADYTGNNPMTGATDNYKLYRPGTILDVDNNTEYEFPAIAANLAHMADGKSSLLRSAAAGVGMPEYMLTADAANGNFASTQVAESPAIADFLGLQHDTGEVFGAGVYVDGADNGLSWAAIAYAVEQGELNPDVLELVTLKSEGPNIVVRDRNQETQRLSLLADKGIISRDEWAKAEGREKAAQTDEEVQAAKDAEMQKQMALKQPAGKPVVKEAFDEDQHPRDDAGKFTNKGGEGEKGEKKYNPELEPQNEADYEANDRKRTRLSKQITEWTNDADHLSDGVRNMYRDALASCTDRLSIPMLREIAINTSHAKFYASTSELTEKFGKGLSEEHSIGGVWAKQPGSNKGVLHLNGDGATHRTHEVYLHEMGHALDIDHKHSNSLEWKSAWLKEINLSHSPLSDYAKTSPSEGFAEFIRLYGTSSYDDIKSSFPECWKTLEKWGYT